MTWATGARHLGRQTLEHWHERLVAMGTHEVINWAGLGERDYFPDPLGWEHNLRVAKPWRPPSPP